MICIKISGQLSEFAGGKSDFHINSVRTVKELISVIEEKFPSLAGMIADDTGRVREFVNIFADGIDIRELGREQANIIRAKEILILPSIAGGSSYD